MLRCPGNSASSPQPRPSVWRDTRQIDDGAQFAAELETALAASDLLVVVLSPNWLQRAWCRRELETFARNRLARDGEGLRNRIVCVVKSHVPPEARPELLQGQVGYQFFEIAKDNNEQAEFFRGRPLNDKCVQLADELTRQLYELAGTQAAPPAPLPPPVGPNGRTVFVAWPATDMEQAYETIVQELTGRGFAVVPKPVPLAERFVKLCNPSEAEVYLDEQLQQAELSIHLLGDLPGFAADKAPPLASLQLLRAARRVEATTDDSNPAATGFQRLIWAPKALGERADQLERDPIVVLKRMDEEALRWGDKVEGDVLPKFVHFVLDRLESRCRFKAVGGIADVYLQFQDGQEADLTLAINVAAELRRAGLKADLTPIDPDEGREALHRQRLRECDAILFCWMQASDTWIRNNTDDLKRWKDFGRDKPFKCGSVVMAPPPKLSKKAYKALRPDTVRLIEVPEPPLPQEAIAPLVRLLNGDGA